MGVFSKVQVTGSPAGSGVEKCRVKHSRKNTVVPRNRFPLDQGRGLSRTAEIAEISAHGAGRWAVCSDLRSLSAVSSFAHTTLSGGGGGWWPLPPSPLYRRAQRPARGHTAAHGGSRPAPGRTVCVPVPPASRSLIMNRCEKHCPPSLGEVACDPEAPRAFPPHCRQTAPGRSPTTL